jgi:hypothetical protein
VNATRREYNPSIVSSFIVSGLRFYYSCQASVVSRRSNLYADVISLFSGCVVGPERSSRSFDHMCTYLAS